MKRPSTATVNHTIVFSLFVGGMVCMVLGTLVLIRLIVPYSDPETVILAQVLSGIAWILSWVLRGAYKSHRDMAFSDMGPITLRTHIAQMEQTYANKYGHTKIDEKGFPIK